MTRREAGVLLCLGCALRLLLLNARSLWFDEAATLCLSRLPFGDIVGRVRVAQENPPLHYLLMHVWTLPFADPVFGLRLFSALCGIASLAVFMRLCRRLIPQQALLASFLAACSSFWIHFAQDGRIYSLLLLLGLLSTEAFLRLRQRWSWPGAAAYAALGAAGLYTHSFFAFTLLGQLLWQLPELIRVKEARRRWACAYAAIGLVYAPWLLAAVSQLRELSTVAVLWEPLTPRLLASVTGTMLFDTSFLSLAHPGVTLGVGVAALALTVASMPLLRRAPAPEREAALFCAVQWLAPLAALRLLEAVLHHALTQARYLICLSPFLLMLLALILDRPSRFARALRLACALAVAAGTAGYFAGTLYVDPHLAQLAVFLRSKAAPGEPIVYLDPYYYLPMRYYYLPERVHRMAGTEIKVVNWDGLPGYRAYLSPAELKGLRRCIVIDPRHSLSRRTVGVASGAEVAAVADP